MMIYYNVNDLRELIIKILLIGVLSILVTKLWNSVSAINKILRTSSYVLYTRGWALIVMAFLIWFIYVHEKSKYLGPFFVIGVNPLFAYIFAELWTSLMSGVITFQFEGGLI